MVQAVGLRGRKAEGAGLERKAVDRDDVFLHRDARAAGIVGERFGENKAVGHYHVLKQRVELRVGRIGQLLGKLFLDRTAPVSLRVLHRQRQPAVRGDRKRRRAGRGGTADLRDLGGDFGKDRVEGIGIGKPLACLIAVVTVVVVSEIGEAVFRHLAGHIHGADQLLGKTEFGIDRAAAVRLEHRVGNLTHAAAEQRCHQAECERRSK